MTFALYPPVKKLRIRQDAFCLDQRRYISISNPCSDRLAASIHRFQSQLTSNTELTFGKPAEASVLLWIDVSATKNHRTMTRPGTHNIRPNLRAAGKKIEDYEITCSKDSLRINASSEAGVNSALQTLAQIFEHVLLETEPQPLTALPCFSISDWPDIKARGVMLDISRTKVPTMDTLLTLIDQFSTLKYNQIQLYTEHTFAFSNHRQVWQDASPYTASDIINIRQYCEDRFIDLVPNLNSFGHFERWLRHPTYHHLAECPDGFIHPFGGKHIPFGSTLKPNAASIKLLRELYDEYLPLFDSPYFNIGGDEPWELGEGWSKAKSRKEGATNVYIDFLAKIKQQVDKRDHKMMFWSDIVLKEPECLKKLSKDLIALNWGYEGNHPFARECKLMAAQKIPFYVCPGTSSWNSLTGRTTNMQTNVANAARQGKKYGADGYLVTDWGDYGHHQYLPVSYAGFLLGACHAWNHTGTKKIDPVLGINRRFLGDKSGKTGEILWNLGLVMDSAPSKLRNQTIFNRLLFWDMDNEPLAVTDIPDTALDLCESAFLDLEAMIQEIAPARDKALLQKELKNAIALARHGIHRLQVYRGARIKPSNLRKNLEKAIKTHRSVWLARNHPGGLSESCDHLQQSYQAL